MKNQNDATNSDIAVVKEAMRDNVISRQAQKSYITFVCYHMVCSKHPKLDFALQGAIFNILPALKPVTENETWTDNDNKIVKACFLNDNSSESFYA